MNQEELLAVEEDFLQGLLDAANDQAEEVVKIEVVRGNKKYFEFGIRPLNETQFLDARKQATTYVKARSMGGVRVPESVNSAKFHSLLIYRATVDKDRKKLWDNKKAWETLNVLNGPDLIDKVLKAGEKDSIIEKLEEISGYNYDDDEVESVEDFTKK